MSRYADWKAPKTDTEHLIWPQPGQIIADARKNHAALASAESVRVQRVPLSRWRRELRQSLHHGDDQLLIATGHQVELYHPGVWVKNVLLDAVRRSSGATSLHIAVDTDSPKHLQLRWPGGAVDLSDDLLLKTGEWSGQVAPPTPAHLKRMIDRVNTARKEWPFEPTIDRFFRAFADKAATAAALPAALLESCRDVDQSLGLQYDAIILSPLLSTPAYLAFVHHLCADIVRFSQIYNTALADYRAEAGIKSTTRPIPDLLRNEASIEIPFWFDDLATGDRSRATLTLHDGQWHLLATSAAFKFDPSIDGDAAAAALSAFLQKERLRLSPRALTLTMFLRLFLVDQFVHGIGGGRYDQVTDRIIETYWNLPAPTFCVTTATLVFPAAREMHRECIPCVASEGHKLRHSLVPKTRYLEAIAAAPRKSGTRRAQFAAMHQSLADAAESTGKLRQWRQKYEATLAQEARDKVLFDRELFYAIQPQDRLDGMIARYRAAFESAPA
ncbi:MAG: hypothetical protein ACTHLZ_17950 [Tepidisphaeraceae bacterium]